jgi:Flp pilus assembly protein TadG
MTNSCVTRLLKNRRGDGLVEYALIYLLFFTVFYGVIEFGRTVASFNILAGATREAGRYAMVHGTASGHLADQAALQNVVRQWALVLDPSAITVTATWTPVSAPAGGSVLIQSQYRLTPFSGIFGGVLTLRSSSQMVISR